MNRYSVKAGFGNGHLAVMLLATNMQLLSCVKEVPRALKIKENRRLDENSDRGIRLAEYYTFSLQGYKNVNPKGEEGIWLRINQEILHLY